VPARFEAYAQYFSDGDNGQKLNSTWANRGPEQLEKCAEALALRKAFPEELGGLYLQEELRDEETVSAVAQPESSPTLPTSGATNVPNLPNTVMSTGKIVNTETVQEPKKPVARKKKESVPDAGKPWGGEFEPKTATTPGSPVQESPATVTNGQNIHGLVIKDEEVPFPGDDKKTAETFRLPTEEEAKKFRERLIAVKDKGYAGLGQWILKRSGKPRTQDIPYAEITRLVDEVEAAEKAGKLKTLLEVK